MAEKNGKMSNSENNEKQRIANLAGAFAKFVDADPEFNGIFDKGVGGITSMIDDGDFPEEEKEELKLELGMQLLEGLSQLMAKYNISNEEMANDISSLNEVPQSTENE